MLRGVSGPPGSCKSLWTVDQIMYEKEYQGREVYAHGIEGWERAIPIRCENQDCRSCRKLPDEVRGKMHSVEKWQDWAPVGCLIVIDEAHYPFPSRREVKAPGYIVRLTESRHDGTDWWLITPNINFMDITVRRLLEEHIHFQKGKLYRYRIRHTGVMENDEALRFGDKEKFFISSLARSYKHYKSADLHVTLKREMPFKVYVIAAMCVVVVWAAWWSYSRVTAFRRDAREEVATKNQARADRSISAVADNEPSPVVSVMDRYMTRSEDFVSAPVTRGAGDVGACVRGAFRPEMRVVCRCFNDRGYDLRVAAAACAAVVEGEVEPRSLVLTEGRYNVRSR